MSNSHGFDLRPDGTIIAQPLVGYSMASAAGTTVLARLEYIDVKDGREIRGSVQLALTPQAAMQVADTLTKQARQILDAPVPGPKERN